MIRSQIVVHHHLDIYGMSVSYTNWTLHGEMCGAPGIITDNVVADPPEDDHHVEDEGSMENDVIYLLDNLYPYASESGFNKHLSKLIDDAKRPVGPDTKVTKLEHIVSSLYVKSKHNMSNKAFDAMQKLNNSVHPSSAMPKSYYEMKP